MTDEFEKFEAESMEALEDELSELDADFAEFAEDGAFDLEDDELFEELETEISEANLGECPETMSMGMLAESDHDMQFLGGWLKKKVKKLLRKLIALARKYGRRCRGCVPLLLKAIKYYKARKYASALRYAYKAYRCFRKCLS